MDFLQGVALPWKVVVMIWIPFLYNCFQFLVDVYFPDQRLTSTIVVGVGTLAILATTLIFEFLGRHHRITRGPSISKHDLEEVNDSLDQPTDQSGVPKMQVIFFHGLPSHDTSDMHLSTWRHTDGFLWPQVWLVERFPGIHVFFAKYDAAVVNASFHLSAVCENLVSDLLQADIGQVSGCPVVLVGHCIGGLVIKKLCLTAYEEYQKLESSMDFGEQKNSKKIAAFLESVKGIFFYSTPHHGMRETARASQVLRGPLFQFIEPLSKNASRLNASFNKLCMRNKWKIEGVGENRPVKSGVFKNVLVVEEASARLGVENFYVLSEDHFSVCKPMLRSSTGFNRLTNLLDSIAQEEIITQARAAEESFPENHQHLPKSVVGLEHKVQEIISRLERVVTLGLIGMGGSGKTTLAKAIFNEVGSKYEYSCFVPEIRLISGGLETTKTVVWSYLHRNGTKVGGEIDWSKLRRKDLFFVFDDISSDRDVDLLLDIAKVSSARSRFLATSRERDVFSLFDAVYEISVLDAKSAHQVFMSYAFPNGESASPELRGLVTQIVEKCEGLPLALQVLGQFLKRRLNKQEWMGTLAALDKADEMPSLNERLWSKLMPSIDGLRDIELQMFLDATTFFYDESWSLREGHAAWRAVYGKQEMVLWKKLVDRSLVYHVEDHENIKIHEQIRSLGRKIASESSKHRVLDVSTAMRVLLSPNKLDIKNMHALRLPSLHGADAELQEMSAAESIDREAKLEKNILVDGEVDISKLGIQNLKSLRYLDIGCHGTGDGAEVTRFPSSLVVLRLYDFPTYDLANLNSLVVLKVYVDSLGLDSLANSIGQLSALRILVLSSIHSFRQLRTIPEDIGKLSNLEVLEISHCSYVPASLGELSKLKIMTLHDCGDMLPDSFGNLSALERLVLRSCELSTLPGSFGRLSALKSLEITNCHSLESLPESFGLLSVLSDLQIKSCPSLNSLPESFPNLSALRRLEMDDSVSLSRIGKLTGLSYLKLGELTLKSVLP